MLFTTVTMLTLLLKGGWVMLPILLLSILALYALLDRIIILNTSTQISPKWIQEVHESIRNRDIPRVQHLCTPQKQAIQRMISIGITQIGNPIQSLETAIEEAGQREIYQLEKNLSLLGTIAGAAPMLGFLGTVWGLIQTFMAIAQESHAVSPQLLSSGIYQAMITTAAGLVVGIIAYLGYHYILARIQQTTHRLTYTARQFIELVQHYYKPT